jgi:hypothetical protein
MKEEDKVVIKGENRHRKVEKRKRAMLMSGKGTLRQQNELAAKERQKRQG